MNDCEEKAGGAEVYLYHLIELLKSRGHGISTYFSQKKSGIRPIESIFSFRNLFSILKKIKQENPDIIHIQKYNLSLSLSPLVAAKIAGKKTVVTLQDFGLISANSWCVDDKGIACEKPSSIRWVFKKSKSEKKLLNKLYDYGKNVIHLRMLGMFADVCVVPGTPLQEYLKEILPYKEVTTIPHFIPETYSFKKKAKKGFKLAFIGRLEKEKGVMELVKAMTLCDKKWKLSIIGDGSLYSYARGYILKNKLQARVSLRGRLRKEKIEKEYHDADAVIMPCAWLELQGMVGAEAFSTGTPVVAPYMGGIADWLKDGYNGAEIKKIIPEEIKKAIERFDGMDITRLSANARASYLKIFTPDAHYRKLMGAYSLARGAKGGAV
ncbi:TPA: glycosyltransferase family 4 protein [Candidatus Woesearchaeota archaeon]|nr:glycosyltransferase family 4 protein [Candidatus Woesearchaeota archaeon]